MHPGLDKLKKFLDRHDRFIISTHESPDGDGIGAEVAFAELLGSLGKDVVILNSDPVPEKFAFMDADREIRVYSERFVFPSNPREYALIVLDTNDFNNIGTAYAFLKDKVRDVFIIDHHEGGRDKFEENFIKVEASSACEIMYEIVNHFNGTLSVKSAQALYAGILFDTGSFRYPKTSAKTFRIISHLVEIGANPFNIYEEIYENNSLSSFELRALMLASLEIHFNGKLILMKLTPDMLRKSGAPFTEGEMNINLPLTIKGVVASVLVKQDLDGPVKVSLRTKGNYDVSEIAMENSGGGHKNAAGYKSKTDFDSSCRKIVEDMGRFFR
jgi:phosphoesterase RecJ-like protein